MSVMNQSGEEQVECPLCMEPLEVDDLNFFPCTCGYQICRFCWHRIRTDENGLCPACRKAYSENPADFIPLSKEQVAQLKAEKRQRDQQRKAKLSESRKHLASVRVVQRNLVFVVGLPMRLADPEVLKKYEYFGKFGKIHKVVINQSTSYAGTQGPSASAYVTYMKSDDALRAIQNVNNTIMDGKTIKTSLGTTKYCSHFMKNQPCPKPDCMYLHDFGDQEASFTKEQMHAGKHQEYEKKLHDALVSKVATTTTTNGTNGAAVCSGGCILEQPPPTIQKPQQQPPPPSKLKDGVAAAASQNGGTNKENWPQLNTAEKAEGGGKKEAASKAEKDTKKTGRKGAGNKTDRQKRSPPPPPTPLQQKSPPSPPTPLQPLESSIKPEPIEEKDDEPPLANNVVENNNIVASSNKLPVTVIDDNSSFFSQNSFTKIAPDGGDGEEDSNLLLHQHNESLLEFNDTDSWEFDFGYTKHSNHLEELAKQRITVKEGGLDAAFDFGAGQTSFGLPPDTFNTENLLETLAKNSVNYTQSMQSAPAYNTKQDLNGLDQHMSKFFTDFYSRNGYSSPQTPVGMSQHMNNGFHHHNHHHHQQQQQQLNLANKQTLALLQQQRQIEEQLMSLSMTGKPVAPPPQQQQHSYGHLNGYELQNGGGGGLYGYGNSVGVTPTVKSRPIQEDKELDFRFQEAQKALEELVESDSHMHNNTGRNTIGSSQINGLVHSQSGSHLPPPPGFVQSTTHMNSFGSKILPYLNMNSQQQQINPTQNSWPSNFSQMQQSQQQQQQQQQQHKGLGMCNDWKFLDPAILSSRRHIPNMPPLILDHYSPLQQLGGLGAPSQQPPQPQQQPRSSTFDTYGGGGGGGFPNYSPLQPSYNNYSHLSAQQNLNWLGSEINTQISSPPGFRTPGQATKQQEC